jgi:aminoglycoside phosphotransferase (APT) family kinase protein
MSRAERPDAGTMPVREAHRFDEARLAEWMTGNIDGYCGPLRVSQFRGGQSNPTYELFTPKKNYVLRRKPPGKLLKGAHAIEREAKVLSALGSVAFPVAEVYGLCTDDAVIGTWFYVMEMVQGRVFWDATFPEVTREYRPRYFDAMNETLARLHRIDYNAIGLLEYGRPGNYFERQIKRWSTQYLEDTDAGRDTNMDRLIEWLPNNIPRDEGSASLIHGDFRCDNIIFHPTEPRIIAVLDWELSTLGHPLSDLAYNAMMYRMPPYIVAGLAAADLAILNIPTEQEYVAAYCARTDRDSIPGYDFYIAFSFFRIAAIFHGIKGRVIRGTAASAEAKDRVKVFPELAEIAWKQAEFARDC